MLNAMTRAEIWLQDTLSKPLGIDDLAAHLGYSTSQIRRQFGHYFGSSTGVYRDRRRLERAAVLLALSCGNIAQIGVACGYQNHSAFSRAFQRRYGATPRCYRSTIRQTLSRLQPAYDMGTRIEQKSSHYAIMRRLYKAPETLCQLGTPSLHAQDLSRLDHRLSKAAPGMALPDLLSRRIGACAGTSASRRTDIGLCLLPQSEADSLPLPVPYRRLRIATQHYAITCMQDISQLDDALDGLVHDLLRQPMPFHISGETPYVLWLEDHLELRIPLKP